MLTVWTEEGWLTRAIVIDLFSRQVAFFAMSERMTRHLVIDALRMAWFRRRPLRGLIFHSDQGSQYASGDFWEATLGLRHARINEQEGRLLGQRRDRNAVRFVEGRAAARHALCATPLGKDEVIDWLLFYNHWSLHSTLGYLGEMAFEKKPLADKERLAA